MKNILKIFLIGFYLTLGWSCEEESNLQPEGDFELTAAVITTPENEADIILDKENPDQNFSFAWEAATNTGDFIMTYKVLLDTMNSEAYDTPVLSLTAEEGGKGLTASAKASDIDEALAMAGYDMGATVDLTWVVEVTAGNTTMYSDQQVSITRFEPEEEVIEEEIVIPTTLYLSGSATEAGTDLTQALAFTALPKAGGGASNKFEIYTQLTAGDTYSFHAAQDASADQFGGAEDGLLKTTTAITAAESGEYRITVDFNTEKFELFKIDKMSVVGEPFNGGWAGDVPLAYKGLGIWEASVNVLKTGGFVFRANGDWDYLYKHIVGSTSDEILLENYASDYAVTVEDVQATETGKMIITIDLASYTFAIAEDPDAGGPITAPTTLFLLEDGTNIHELVKTGETFATDGYVALQASKTYILNSLADGTGTSYALDASIGSDASGDKISGGAEVLEGAGDISVTADQAYDISIDFSAPSLSWFYYNIKVFHWDPADWDGRIEAPMTYEHPFKFKAEVAMTTGHNTKFNSPWDVQMGSDTATGLTGDLTAGAGDINVIVSDGTYDVTIELASDFGTGTYEMIKQ